MLLFILKIFLIIWIFKAAVRFILKSIKEIFDEKDKVKSKPKINWEEVERYIAAEDELKKVNNEIENYFGSRLN